MSGTQEKPGSSLIKAVVDISQHSFAQKEALKDNNKTLASLKATLSDIKRKGGIAEQELRSKARTHRALEEELEHLELQTNAMEGRCVVIGRENIELQIRITEEEEKALLALAKFNTYRDKMAGHRAAFLHAASQTEAHKELEEKRALVRMLTLKKEELKKDLENPNGNAVQMAKSENDSLKREISERRVTIAEKGEQVQKEFETHTQIKKDIQIQNRRFEAIQKRLCCQLGRAQANHRQMSEDIHHMERQLAQLKGQLESSRGSVSSS
ncbi:coiled-coil domain-containing protein 122 [Pseudoliparis swirei]|uniref:coiled-coil domain-containing protein 122 n=1 Tax=Pseudoliparis swirei TaxID=2059687 RepID=UPI0024BE0722|nr:coiled-coil domain-containing protein 122 [Pseudoliparis swirei]